jgi:hypothetical protein
VKTSCVAIVFPPEPGPLLSTAYCVAVSKNGPMPFEAERAATSAVDDDPSREASQKRLV